MSRRNPYRSGGLSEWQLVGVILVGLVSFISFVMICVALWNAEWHQALRIFLGVMLPSWFVQTIFAASLIAGVIVTAIWAGALFLLF